MYHLVPKLKSGKISKAYVASSYQPSEKEKTVIEMAQRDAAIGRDILTKGWMWYNGRSIIQEIDYNQKLFNSYIGPKSEDPDESWRAQTSRPLTRNKLISIASHVTASILFPELFAQNNQDQEDKDAAMVMRDLVEWVIDNSEYRMTYIKAVLGALTDPAIHMKASFAEVMRKVKTMKADGTYDTKEIIDEFMSGFLFAIRQCNEIYITNANENNVQKQRALGERQLIDFYEAEAKYGTHANWKCVTAGVRTIFDKATNTFYNIEDTDLTSMQVEEYTYRNRYFDLEVTFINGVCVTDPERALSRNDKRYPFAKTGYEFLNNGNFYYYKSAANKLGPDQDLIDTMYNMVMDGTFLALMSPKVLYGSEEVNSSVMVPGAITQFKDPNTKMEDIGPKSDIRAGLQATSLIEKSMSESSQDAFQQGLMQSGERTAEEIQTIQKNAQIALGLFGRMLQDFVEQLGWLIVGDILQYMTVADLNEIVSESGRLKFKSFILPGKIHNGKAVTKKIRFTDKYYNTPDPTHEDLMKQSFDLMGEEDDMGGNTVIMDVNPDEFRKIRFLVKVRAGVLQEESKAMEKALNLEAYDRAIQNPIISQDRDAMEAVTRDFMLEIYKPGETDKYLPKKQEAGAAAPQNMQAMGQEAAAGMVPNQQKGVNSNLIQQITGTTSARKPTR